ncbi:MAG: phosphotransferase [Tahibacter sp.]
MNVDLPRTEALRQFVAKHVTDVASLQPASNDASFRSYWRATTPHGSFIVMDSPPALEPVDDWLKIGARLRGTGLHAPQVHVADPAQGFLLLEDLGVRPYLAALNADSADTLYRDALAALFVMQSQVDASDLPHYSTARLISEMEFMPEWFLRRHLGVVPECDEWDHIELAFRRIVAAIDAQPRVFVHRDFHSRNLMITDSASPGIIDFQGAMNGPLTYDLVSLLRDCYIAWPEARVTEWLDGYRMRLVHAGLTDADGAQFRRWFDLTGLQRHLKVLGIFCRLCYRDAKPAYLADLPLVLRYCLSVMQHYPELKEFARLLERSVGDRDISQARTEANTP